MNEVIITKYMSIHLLNSFVFTGEKTETMQNFPNAWRVIWCASLLLKRT